MNYDDIIDIVYPFRLKHSRMSIYQRSSQFAPFAALKGHNDLINETARLTDQKRELDDNFKEILNEKLSIINNNIKTHPKVSITYFVKDNKKTGGKYTNVISKVKRIDLYSKEIILLDKIKIKIDDIVDVSIL